MNRRILELATASALTFGAILASAADARASDISVKDAFARASATQAAKTGAVYFTIVNAGGEDKLTAVETPVASSTMLHGSAMDDVDGMKIVNGETKLAPGQSHVMLMGLVRPLKQGESIHLTLVFDKAGKIEADIPVAGVAAMAP